MSSSAVSLRRWLAAATLLVLAGVQSDARAQVGAAPRDSAVKAAFLYKFGSFVQWPATAFKTPQEPLVIGVLGDEAVADDLDQLAAGRSVEDRPLRIRTLKDGEAPGPVHILFIGTMRPQKLRDLLAALHGPVLVVTQQEGALAAGSVINFVADGARVRFDASLASADVRDLKLSARLLAVARNVEGRQR
jgi:YfiR/HmsC-like